METSHIPINENAYSIDAAVGKRFSQDKVIDTRGKDLLDLCISNQLRILNGRSFGDSCGAYTCFKPTGCSVIDYIIISQRLMSQVLYMSVSNFMATMSDCHCKMSFKLLASFKREFINDNLVDFPNRYIWNDSTCELFQKALTSPVYSR